jgi:hypothetical protein
MPGMRRGHADSVEKIRLSSFTISHLIFESGFSVCHAHCCDNKSTAPHLRRQGILHEFIRELKGCD